MHVFLVTQWQIFSLGGEDERVKGCKNDLCHETEFQCHNDQCIPKEHTCDNEDDCGDGSDESVQVCKAIYDATTCKEKEFKCKSNGACIRSDRICNSYRNEY